MATPTVSRVRNYLNTGAGLTVYRSNLTDGSISYLKSIDGCGMPPNHRLTQTFPNSNIVTDFGFRLDPRTITLNLVINGSSLADLQNKLQMIYQLFAPNDSDTQDGFTDYLEIVDINSNTYWIEARTIKVNADPTPKSGYVRDVKIMLKCSDPLFILQGSYTFSFAAGSSTVSASLPGNFCDPGLIFYIYPGGASVRIYQGTGTSDGTFQNAVIDMTGYTVPAGTTAIIDCQPRSKGLYTMASTNTQAYISAAYQFVGNINTGFLASGTDISVFGMASANIFASSSSTPITYSFVATGMGSSGALLEAHPRYLAIPV